MVERRNHESKQSVVGKRRLYRDCRLDASIWRSSRQVSRNNAAACGCWTSAAEMAPRRFLSPFWGLKLLESTLPRTSLRPETNERRRRGLSRLTFQEGDACDLQGVSDHSFDLTLSVFGAMFAPKPFDVAREMVRVTRPGGRIVMGNWIPNDPTSFVSQLLKISSSFMPPPPEGFVSPMTWGVEYSHHRAFWSGRSAQGENIHGQGHVLLHLA